MWMFANRNALMPKRYIAAYILIALVSLTFVMSYLIKPRAAKVELVCETQELPDPKAHYSLASGLEARVSKSYGLALVLVISEFSQKNAVALEALRSWAHANFQHDPAFLHAVEAPSSQTEHNSLLDSFCYSLLAPPETILESGVLRVLKHQIASFHQTRAYQSFRADYFDCFGLDHESANMLARYQSERASLAVGVLLSCLYWIAALSIGIALHFRAHPAGRSTRWQRSLAFFWFALALFYIILSWVGNLVSVLVSSIVCVLAGLYLRRPIAVSFGDDKGLNLRLLVPDREVLVGVTWVTATLVAVQILTWMHTGSMASPDPITLMISSLTGDFVHDPFRARRYIARIIGCLWLVSCMWAMGTIREARSRQNFDDKLAPINDSIQ